MTKEKTHWRRFHNPDYIGAYAFQPGERKILTIQKAGLEAVTGQGGKKEDCLVVRFKEDEKPLIVNVTNSKAIEKVSGSGYIEDWAGTAIELYTTEVQAFGESVEAVRVKPTPPKITKPELTPDHAAWDKVIAAVKDGYTRDQVEEKYTVSDENWNEITKQEA